MPKFLLTTLYHRGGLYLVTNIRFLVGKILICDIRTRLQTTSIYERTLVQVKSGYHRTNAGAGPCYNCYPLF